MAINLFLFSIIAFSIFLVNIGIEEKVIKDDYTNIPLITFDNSIMYDIDDKNIKQMVQSRQALNYKYRDELYDATIIKRDNNNSNSMSAELILKKGNIYKMYQNVNLTTTNNYQLITDFLVYNEKTKVAYNNVPFILNQNNSELTGDNLYYDGLKNIIKAKNTHFIIKTGDIK